MVHWHCTLPFMVWQSCALTLYMLCSRHSSLTFSIQHSPSWEADRFSASQEIPHILWNPKDHYRTYKSPPPVFTLSQVILSSHLCLGLPSGLFPSGFPIKILYATLLSPIRSTCSSHLSKFFLIYMYTHTHKHTHTYIYIYIYSNITLNFGPQGPSTADAV